MIIIFDYFKDKINEYKKRNRNRPSYYRYFLIWLSFLILITAIFYCLGLFDLDSDNNPTLIKSTSTGTQIMTPTQTNISKDISFIEANNEIDNNFSGIKTTDSIYKVNPTFKTSKKINLNDIENNISTRNLNNNSIPAKILQNKSAMAPQMPLYDEVLKTVANIPPPLTFVDDYKFEL